ncbi:MAG: restriction endonuclease subunit S [Gammaproteobacteria bacterium]|nr:restriction endonuclease subunit S [Gammaproteobacteria bacterium]
MSGNGHRLLSDFVSDGSVKIQNGFPCGKWNDRGEGILHLRPFNISNRGQIDLSSTKFVETDKKLDNYLLQEGDVIFNNTNSEELVGKTAYWDRNERSVLSNHMTILRVLEDEVLDPQFLAFFLLEKWLERHFEAICRRHVNQASVNTDRLGALELPPFSTSDQKKIAHILSTVQRAIEAQERIIQTTTELKKALMHKLFTEGLRNEPQKQTEIGLVPESWASIRLGELCEKPSGALQTGPFGSQLHKDEYQEEGIAVVNPTHLAGNMINHENLPRVSEGVARLISKHQLQKFDILFARRGEIGRQGFVTEREEGWICGTGCFLVRASKPFMDNRFLSLYLAAEPLVKWLYSHAAGAIMPNLNNTVMRRLPVFYPDLDTQIEIINVISSLSNKTKAASRKREILQALFRTLLHKLMTAKTRVHELEVPA